MTINHHAFFEHLGNLEKDTPEWHAVTAGLVVLRLFDAWVELGPPVVTTDMSGQQAVRAAIARVPAGDSSKNVLSSVVDAMWELERVDMSIVGPRLLAYGKSLDYTGKLKLSVDVFKTVVAHTHPLENASLAIEGNKHLGRGLRTLAQWDESAAAFAMAAEIAQRTGDVFNVLWASVGAAKISLARGNFPKADAELDNAITMATAYRLDEIKHEAMHEKARVAHRRGDFELAIRLGYELLESQINPSWRDRVLLDMATFFADLGIRSTARDAHLVLAATAQEQVVRWAATLSLLGIAALDGHQPAFEQYKKELEDVPLQPEWEANYYYLLGKGYENFNSYDLARNGYEKAIAIAAANGFNEEMFRFEAALASLGKKEKEEQKSKTYEEVSPEVAKIASAIGQMRKMAGV